jgi:hypothetical protein
VASTGEETFTCARTATPREPSEFITTTIQSPSRVVQLRVCVPVPAACATQVRMLAGTAGTAGPACSVTVWSPTADTVP